MNTPIEIDNLSFSYEKQKALQNINLRVAKGSFLGLVGPNGSGKSTLMKCLLGLLTPDEGSVRLFGTPVTDFQQWEKIGYVSQKANGFNTSFPATVYEVVSMGLYGKVGLFRFLTKKHKEKVHEALETVRMNDFVNRNINQLSGGQQQRVFIARALVSDPKLLILDEPTVGVDAQSVENFYQLLTDLNEEKEMTLVLVSHDIETLEEQVSDLAYLNQTLHFEKQAYLV